MSHVPAALSGLRDKAFQDQRVGCAIPRGFLLLAAANAHAPQSQSISSVSISSSLRMRMGDIVLAAFAEVDHFFSVAAVMVRHFPT